MDEQRTLQIEAACARLVTRYCRYIDTPFALGEYHDEYVFDGVAWRMASRTMRYAFKAA